MPIPGTKRIAYLEENAGAVEIELSREVLDQLNQVAPVGVTSGERYGEAMMSMLDRRLSVIVVAIGHSFS